ncbi:YSIRK-type signal peptide-containing protein [Gemella sp. Musashino-2025]
MKKQEKFSIRKYKIGAASVLIGLGIAISGGEVIAQSTYIPTTKMTPPYDLQVNGELDKLKEETKQKINEDAEKLKQLINTKESLNSEDKKSAKERVEEEVKSATGKIDALNKGEKSEDFKKKITDIKNTFIKDIQKINIGLLMADKKTQLKNNKNLTETELTAAIKFVDFAVQKADEMIDKVAGKNIDNSIKNIKEEFTKALSKINPIGADLYLNKIGDAKAKVLKAIKDNKNLSEADKTQLEVKISKELEELTARINNIASKGESIKTAEEAEKAQKDIIKTYLEALKTVATTDITLELANKQSEINKSKSTEDSKNKASAELEKKAEEVTENINKAENSDILNKVVDQGKKDIANIKVKEDNKEQKPDTPKEPKQPNTPTPPKGSAIPQDGVKNLSTDKPQLKVTRWVDENGKEIKSTSSGELHAGMVDGYTFDKTTKEDGITTHHF